MGVGVVVGVVVEVVVEAGGALTTNVVVPLEVVKLEEPE